MLNKLQASKKDLVTTNRYRLRFAEIREDIINDQCSRRNYVYELENGLLSVAVKYNHHMDMVNVRTCTTVPLRTIDHNGVIETIFSNAMEDLAYKLTPIYQDRYLKRLV